MRWHAKSPELQNRPLSQWIKIWSRIEEIREENRLALEGFAFLLKHSGIEVSKVS